MRYSNAKVTLHISLRSMLLLVMSVASACAFAIATSAATQFFSPLAAIATTVFFAVTFMLTAASLADDLWEDPGMNFAAAILAMFTFPFLLTLLMLLVN